MHFSRQRHLADRGFQLIVPDRPGHGLSASPGRPDDAEADGELVAQLLSEGTHLVGHSFGGAVALAAANRRMEMVRSLTLIEPAMQMLALNDARVRRFVVRIITAMIFSRSPVARAQRFAGLVGIPRELRGGDDRDELEKIRRAIKRLKVPSAKNLRSELEAVRAAGVPLLVVTGGWNPAFTAIGDRVAALGGGRHQIIPSTHHFTNLFSDEFNDIFAAFVGAAETASKHE